jgi:RpiR family transcriptional regulator, carbohydrate utilization regulator
VVLVIMLLTDEDNFHHASRQDFSHVEQQNDHIARHMTAQDVAFGTSVLDNFFVTSATSPAPHAGTLELIRARLGQLSPAERLVAECVLTDPVGSVLVSITELADRAGVGEATVSRFCRRLGMRGFQHLKISIASESSATVVARGMAGTADDGPARESASAVATVTALLECTGSLLDPGQLDRAAAALCGAKRIFVYGQGASMTTALDAQHRMLRLGITAFTLQDSHSQAMSASLLGPGDACLAFSHSGSSKDVVACQQAARAGGAETVCVTSAARSPLAAASTTVLLTATEVTLVSNLRSKIMQLFVLEQLMERCAALLGERAEQALERTTAAVLEKMY